MSFATQIRCASCTRQRVDDVKPGEELFTAKQRLRVLLANTCTRKGTATEQVCPFRDCAKRERKAA